MTDATNHAEVIRKALEDVRRCRPDDELPDPGGVPGLKRMAYSLIAENAMPALDALTRELEDERHAAQKWKDSEDLELVQAKAVIAAQSERIAKLEEAAQKCRVELYWCDRQLCAQGATQGNAVKEALALADAALAPRQQIDSGAPMTDTTNHAEVIRNWMDHEGGCTHYNTDVPERCNCGYTKALTALDALTRELDEANELITIKDRAIALHVENDRTQSARIATLEAAIKRDMGEDYLSLQALYLNQLNEAKIKDARIATLEEALDLHENKTHLYPGQHNFRFHVISHDSWDATPAAHKWLDGIRATSAHEERERIITLLTNALGCGGAPIAAVRWPGPNDCSVLESDEIRAALAPSKGER